MSRECPKEPRWCAHHWSEAREIGGTPFCRAQCGLAVQGWHQCGGGQDLQIRPIKKNCSTVTTAEVSAVSHKIKAATVADLSPALCGSGKSCRRATVDRSGCKGNCLGILNSP